jgi:hypothetical protein
MRADSAADARICEGRRAISFGNPSNFFGTDRGSKILVIKTGHIIRLTIGEMVYRNTSPTKGTAGADKATTSGRKVG